MKKSFLITAALAAFGAASAFAQISYTTGDLLVGFSQAGATNNLQIDLGAAFPLTSSSTIDFGNISSALTGLGGTGAISWSSFAQVSTPVAGSLINGVTYLPNALFLSENSAPAAITSPTATGPSSTISTIALGVATYTPISTGLVSGVAAYQATGNVSSYSTLQASTFAQQVSGTNGAGSISIYLLNSLTPAVTVGKKTTPQSDELPTLIGTLNLSSTGQLTFTAAIPEPSTYAALLGIATLGFVAIRRRKQAAQLVA
jgi:hypothetical protein